MAFDRQGTGLVLTRIGLGVFFLAEGIGKWRWLFEPQILVGQLTRWFEAATPGSIPHTYLAKVAVPYAVIFARLVPVGEMSAGLGMVLGIWTPFSAFVAFFMALNFHVASGAIFTRAFLTSGYGLPVLAPTLGLVFSGKRLPFSVRG